MERTAMATKNRFGDFASDRVKEPEYPLPEAVPSAPVVPVAPHVPTTTASKAKAKPRSAARLHVSSSNPTVPFGSYMTPEDDARLKMLVAKVGKKKVRLFAEALALLFEHYKADLADR